MPPSLPHVSGAEAVRALEKPGFIVLRQKGSHVILRRGSTGGVVSLHRELKIGTLSGVIKQAGGGRVPADALTGQFKPNPLRGSA